MRFERRGNRYYCRLIGKLMTTQNYKFWVRIIRKPNASNLAILQLWSDGDNNELADQFSGLVGEKFATIDDIEEKMGMYFLP